MFDRQLASEILLQLISSAKIITDRFSTIHTVADFTSSPAGMERLDSICMQLIVVGEGLKNFDKVTNHEILANYTGIEWKKAMGLRDIITHHYADVNAEAIFDTCKSKLPALKQTLEKILSDIQNKP